MSKILSRLVSQLKAKGKSTKTAYAIATSIMQKSGNLKIGTKTNTAKGSKRGNMTPAERAKDRMAKISGKPMQWVENKVNRATTFKIAYSKMHQDLSNNSSILRRHMETKYDSKKKVEDAVDREINRRSSRFAANMVKELHYEYSSWAKPKILQSPGGSILGQFSTYGINFFEYNRKIAMDAGDALLSGEWSSPEAARLYRMAGLYLFTTALLEPLTNAKWSNLIEHDTKERLNDLFKFITGDEKEKKKTFFGKGPLIGNMGPFVSDIFTLGNVIGFTKLSDNELMSYLGMYQQKAREIKDDRLKDAVGLLNMNLSKFIFSSAPKMRDGTGFMTILGTDYLQLWNTTDIRERREQMLLYPEKYGPDMFKQMFRTTKQKKERKERLQKIFNVPQGTEINQKAIKALDDYENMWGR